MANITWSEYVDRYADLGNVWKQIENKTAGDQYDYWSSVLGDNPTKESFGQYHWEKEGGSSGTYDGQNRSIASDWTSTTTSTDTTTVNTNTDPSTGQGAGHGVTYNAPDDYVSPDKIVTAAAEDRPDYAGPEHEGYRDYDPTPVGITLAEVQDDELVENRIAAMLDKGSPLFRQAAEAMARRFGNRGPRTQEAMMGEIMKVAGPIAMADALMLERHRALRNTAFYDQMKTRLTGAIQETLSHIAGGYQIQATLINDITNRWKAQLLADVQTYGIDVDEATKVYGVDVGAATKIYGTDVAFQSSKYVADIQKFLGMEGLKVKFAEIFANIEDNAEAAAFIWDMVFGDNNLNPSEWIKKWKEMYEDDDDSTSTNTNTIVT
tara:strand:+ start:4693 stop:5826 length:1134 start_codon:yes stop_codon:yes gene_type:complete